MSTLVHAALTVRRSARAGFGFVVALIFAGLCLLGIFHSDLHALGLHHGIVAAGWVGVFALRVSSRFTLRGRKATSNGTGALDIELGLLLLVAAHAAVQVSGGLSSELYPLVFVLVAGFAAFAKSPAGGVLIAVAIAFEAALWFGTEGRQEVRPFALHAGFLVVFGFLNVLFTRAEIARVRENSRRELDQERAKVKDDARLFRLASAPSTTSASDEERLYRSSLQEVHDALFHTLDLLRRTLDLHTCVLLFLDESRQRLSIVELSTESDDIADGPFQAGEGAVGAVASRGLVMNLENLKPGYKGLCYYQEPARVKSFLGVPILDQNQVRGALCGDRLDGRPFSPRDEAVFQDAVEQVLRTLENERLFVQLERQKREQTILYQASQKLGAALTEDAVVAAGLEAAEAIAPFEFAAVTTYDAEQRRHVVTHAQGEDAERYRKLSFRDNTSLTAMVVKNHHYLPYRGDFDPKQQVLFTRRANLRGMKSLLVMPLIVREDPIGTVSLAARRRDAFSDAVRPTLELLTNQVGVALSNAQAVRRLEEMATTDGLTGCLNKRAFLEELEQKLRSAERFGRPLSLLVTDIDHFKSVNDTYGHATGDVVIKELGAILRRAKRETDVVARFGGEEFCVLCEETDTEGARLLAERIREELLSHEFQTELGKLKVTASIGVATFPSSANDAAGLFEVTDKALYAAKHNGRNQVCTAADVP